MRPAWKRTRSSREAFATFPWPDPVDEKDKRAVAAAAAEVIRLRREHCATDGVGLTRLYNLMDEGAYRDLDAAHRRLDRAALGCYAWPATTARDRDEIVARLARLNFEIVSGRPYGPFGTPTMPAEPALPLFDGRE